MESVGRIHGAVKSVCERDPAWWAQRRLRVAIRQAELNCELTQFGVLRRRQPLDYDLTPFMPAPEAEDMGVRSAPTMGWNPARTRVMRASGAGPVR